MANLTNSFVTVIEEGIKSMQAISDPEKKALVAAELGKAIAQTGLVGSTDTSVLTAEAAAEKKSAIKEDKAGKKAVPAPEVVTEDKQKPKPAPKPKKEEPVAEAPAEEAAPEETDGTEWTDETQEKFADELDFIGSLMDSYGDDGQEIIDQCVVDWSEGQYASFDDITPENIVAFKTYLEMLLADAEDEAQ